jgi:hypothetical protein
VNSHLTPSGRSFQVTWSSIRNRIIAGLVYRSVTWRTVVTILSVQEFTCA